MTPEKPYATGLTLSEAMNQALELSLEVVTETAVAYPKTEPHQPSRDEKKWAVVMTEDCDRDNWVVASDVRYDAGHSHPDNPWQVHLKGHRNPYKHGTT